MPVLCIKVNTSESILWGAEKAMTLAFPRLIFISYQLSAKSQVVKKRSFINFDCNVLELCKYFINKCLIWMDFTIGFRDCVCPSSDCFFNIVFQMAACMNKNRKKNKQENNISKSFDKSVNCCRLSVYSPSHFPMSPWELRRYHWIYGHKLIWFVTTWIGSLEKHDNSIMMGNNPIMTDK